jgi:hypothetical protein
MNRAAWGWSFASLAFIAVGCTSDLAEDEMTSEISSAQTGDLRGAPEPKIHGQRDNAGRPKPGPSSPLLLFHNGAILAASKPMAIFWGPSWNNAAFAGDKISGLDGFFDGWSGSNYAGTCTEYTGTNGQVTSAATYLGHVIDATTPPRRALTVSGAVAEACAVTGNNPDPDGVYFIYTETGAGHVNYCAWHSYGNCSNGKPVQVAYMPNIDGIAGCDPVDTFGTGHSQGLAALANVTAHELAEAITDPRNGGWWDASGSENGDSCAWSFDGPVALSNGSTWKLQMEWSNAAYTAGTGLANRSGQRGCLQGN